jgi:hypothetical protein
MAEALPPRPRILIVEDNGERHRFFTAAIPDTFKLVIVTSAGAAKGLLQRVDTYDYAGVMLDHDLVERCKTMDDKSLSASDLIDSIITKLSPEVPILIHSMNLGRSREMQRKLEAAHFHVTRIPMVVMTPENLHAWLEEHVWETWEAWQEYGV